jgi:hypothetical protein
LNLDKSMLVMVLMIALVIVVVSVSQYQQFFLTSSNSLRLAQISDLLHNQTLDILGELESHTNATEVNLHDTRVNMKYIKDTNQILRQILNMTTPTS